MGEKETCRACGVRELLTEEERDTGICDPCDCEEDAPATTFAPLGVLGASCSICDSIFFTAEEEAARLCLGCLLGCLSSPGGDLP